MAGTARTSSSSIEVYRRNVARELVEAVAAIERDRDRLVFSLRALVNVTEGDAPARMKAINLLAEVTGE